jgi:hypothetical protein
MHKRSSAVGIGTFGTLRVAMNARNPEGGFEYTWRQSIGASGDLFSWSVVL